MVHKPEITALVKETNGANSLLSYYIDSAYTAVSTPVSRGAHRWQYDRRAVIAFLLQVKTVGKTFLDELVKPRIFIV